MSARLCLGLVIVTAATLSAQDLKVRWIHGSDPCSSNTDPAFQVHAFDADTVISYG